MSECEEVLREWLDRTKNIRDWEEDYSKRHKVATPIAFDHLLHRAHEIIKRPCNQFCPFHERD